MAVKTMEGWAQKAASKIAFVVLALFYFPQNPAVLEGMGPKLKYRPEAESGPITPAQWVAFELCGPPPASGVMGFYPGTPVRGLRPATSGVVFSGFSPLDLRCLSETDRPGSRCKPLQNFP